MEIIKGKRAVPQKIMIYGVEGIGKSTLASQVQDTLFIDIEGRLDHIDCHRGPQVKSYDQLNDHLRWALGQSYKAIAIDTFDAMERLIWEKVCAEASVESIEKIGYAKGYQFALAYWIKIVKALEIVQQKTNAHIVLVGHHAIKRFDDPAGDSFDFYTPKLHKDAMSLLKEWVNYIFFVRYKILTKAAGDGFNTKKKALQSNDRVILTRPRPTHVAKSSSLQLPEEIAFNLKFDWNKFFTLINGETKWTSQTTETSTQTPQVSPMESTSSSSTRPKSDEQTAEMESTSN